MFSITFFVVEMFVRTSWKNSAICLFVFISVYRIYLCVKFTFRFVFSRQLYSSIKSSNNLYISEYQMDKFACKTSFILNSDAIHNEVENK